MIILNNNYEKSKRNQEAQDIADSESRPRALANSRSIDSLAPNLEQISPPRYEDVAEGSSSLGRGATDSKIETDAHRASFQSQTSRSSQEIEPDAALRTAALQTSPNFQPDGRFQVSIDVSAHELPKDHGTPINEPAIDLTDFVNAPPMNVNIMIVGSRGDVQPYLALGKQLREHGHTVRITTHDTFRQSVKDAGLRFFNIGGNPRELMSYMVRNPGLMPGFESLTNGDITKKQMMVAEVRDAIGCAAVYAAQDGNQSFAADAIISNPPTFAHIHCAEALGIPLLMTFTMPWSPTTAFPHPLVNVRSSEAEPTVTNYLTYGLADMMTWQGLGHTINKFRRKRLGLPSLSVVSGAGLIERCGVPWTYCMSPTLVPKPKDWINHIDVVGFYFLDLATNYSPPEDLIAFLHAGEPPIYIGFGSIVVQDPVGMTKNVLAAIAQANVRAVISAGWGGLDAKTLHDPEALKESGQPSIFVLGNVPHDWLFERVSAVCHHGGAGTAAIGLRYGKPTIVVPFFGDQPWWADQIYARGAGPKPIPYKELTTSALVDAIRSVLSDDMRRAARRVGELIRSEDGVKTGMDSFHRHLPLLNMRCELDPKRVATWYSRTHAMRLSAFAAQVLAERGVLDVNKLELHRPREYNTRVQASDPISGAVGPVFGIVGDLGAGIGQLFSPHPEKGIIKLVRAAPDAVRGTLEGLHHGLNNSPKLYGGTVREPGRVTGFRSGVREGGKGLVMGFYDGFADIIREPVTGYKKNGIIGGVGGAAIGLVNSVIKPAAGVVGLISQPIEGSAVSARALLVKPAKERHATRYAEGMAAFLGSSETEREAVIQAFEQSTLNMIRKWVDSLADIPKAKIL
ncbi:Sterol 3-beta-glucosyltransferase [Ceratobasidium theobromae]|uniref:Sterol 3-beta-glucosyltransferase n=1 Tax=Ceratobasidium theobromae TaxID=1582974 RepID=A0A5N5Q8S0_9AGAM|nr:Sterol 3-beta-glucosyltransferase [Ceratobasidium theobromae]